MVLGHLLLDLIAFLSFVFFREQSADSRAEIWDLELEEFYFIRQRITATLIKKQNTFPQFLVTEKQFYEID